MDSRQKDYLTSVNTNIIGTMNMLNSLKDVRCKKFINVGTCMEYGDKKDIIKENSHLEPDSIYGSTKASSSIISHQIASENNIDIVTLRPFGVFGEKEGSHKFFPYIILSNLDGKEVNLTPCEQYRIIVILKILLKVLFWLPKMKLLKTRYSISAVALFIS